jgi:hypothetical protein
MLDTARYLRQYIHVHNSQRLTFQKMALLTPSGPNYILLIYFPMEMRHRSGDTKMNTTTRHVTDRICQNYNGLQLLRKEWSQSFHGGERSWLNFATIRRMQQVPQKRQQSHTSLRIPKRKIFTLCCHKMNLPTYKFWKENSYQIWKHV